MPRSSYSVAAIPTAGAHTITARVTDSGGLTGERIVNVTVASAPPPSYCTLKGQVSSYEWISAVKAGTVNNASGNNGGYRDYTSVQFNMPAGSATPLVLTPGFSTSFTERWAVWIDLNRDKVFSASELLYTGFASSSITTSVTIPAGTASGRVSVVQDSEDIAQG